MNSESRAVFMSYARLDNAPRGRASIRLVTRLKELIEQDFAKNELPISVFFDTSEIHGLEDWQLRILGALRRARVMIAVTSPAYLQSTPCRWEWQEMTLRREALQTTFGGVGAESGPVLAVNVETLNRPADAELGLWFDAVQKVHHLDFTQFFSADDTASLEPELDAAVRELGSILSERLRLDRIATSTPGNVRRATTSFVGRADTMRQLNVLVHGPAGEGAIVLLHGVGGVGKTELVVAHANGNRAFYSGGIWSVSAEGATDLTGLLGTLAAHPQFPISTGTDTHTHDLGAEVLYELRRTANEDGPVLLVVDNVSSAQLLSAVAIDELALDSSPNLHVVATSRLGADEFQGARERVIPIAVGPLSGEESVALIEQLRPQKRFASSDEHDAATEISRRLDGLTLAVEQVAVYLGIHSEITVREFAVHLAEVGARLLDRDDEVARGLHHQDASVWLALHATTSDFEPWMETAVHCCSMLPPDGIPLEWVKQVCVLMHPDTLDQDTWEGRISWGTIRRRLLGRHLLLDTEDPSVVRMHRLVGECLTPEGSTRGRIWHHLSALAVIMAWNVQNGHAIGLEQARTVVHVLNQAVAEGALAANVASIPGLFPFLASIGLGQEAARFAGLLVEHLEDESRRSGSNDALWELTVGLDIQGSLRVQMRDPNAGEILARSSRIRQELLDRGMDDPKLLRDKALGLLQQVNVKSGGDDTPTIERAEKALDIFLSLAAKEPDNALYTCDASIALRLIADQLELEEKPEAINLRVKAVSLAERAVDLAPEHWLYRSNLAVQLMELGTSRVHVDRERGEADLNRALIQWEHIHATSPDNRDAARGITTCLKHLMKANAGERPDVARAAGDRLISHCRNDVDRTDGGADELCALASALLEVESTLSEDEAASALPLLTEAEKTVCSLETFKGDLLAFSAAYKRSALLADKGPEVQSHAARAAVMYSRRLLKTTDPDDPVRDQVHDLVCDALTMLTECADGHDPESGLIAAGEAAKMWEQRLQRDPSPSVAKRCIHVLFLKRKHCRSAAPHMFRDATFETCAALLRFSTLFPDDSDLALETWNSLMSTVAGEEVPDELAATWMAGALDAITRFRHLNPSDNVAAIRVAYTHSQIAEHYIDIDLDASRHHCDRAVEEAWSALNQFPDDPSAQTAVAAALDRKADHRIVRSPAEHVDALAAMIEFRTKMFDAAPDATMASELLDRFVRLLSISDTPESRADAADFAQRILTLYPSTETRRYLEEKLPFLREPTERRTRRGGFRRRR